MSIVVKCPRGCEFRILPQSIGISLRCPVCRAALRAPANSEAEMERRGFAMAEAVDEPLALTTTPPSAAPPPDNPMEFLDLPAGPEAVESPPVIEHRESSWAIDTRIEIRAPTPSQSRMQVRYQQSVRDSVGLCRWLAVFLVVIGGVAAAPAIMEWLTPIDDSPSDALDRPPRWAFLLTAIAGLHLVYAVFLWQVHDWSALRCIAVFLASVSCFYALMAGSLAVGGVQSPLLALLEVAPARMTRASLWCGAMLCLSLILAYLTQREANRWQRVEQLLRELGVTA